jgi:hypothetical protein
MDFSLRLIDSQRAFEAGAPVEHSGFRLILPISEPFYQERHSRDSQYQ